MEFLVVLLGSIKILFHILPLFSFMCRMNSLAPNINVWYELEIMRFFYIVKKNLTFFSRIRIISEKLSSTLLKCLRSSKTLNFLLLISISNPMRAFNELRKLEWFFKDESRHGFSDFDLYELVQHGSNVLRRLFPKMRKYEALLVSKRSLPRRCVLL
ncbi:uncharacterized protein LOC110725951 [Chenopodium quinoa]|uniref:uncharacterized protein LOC110725951 n=1 Tax=Chenopodium quinoa TaxID=63459 RepID=UPI000B777951|nr:uncharacterized protein LOC110725951 [Chenopodium quinoa]